MAELLKSLQGYEKAEKEQLVQHEKTVLLAKENGRENAFDQVIEECAELTVTLRHFLRYGTIMQQQGKLTTLRDIYEEIADVEIMLAQIKYLTYGESEVEKIKKEKIAKRLARFGLDKVNKWK